ncbi:protein of unknown function [Streptomyces sp. KY75]|nr:protein of unknown function [Streptomyces sp. KY75]
MRPRRVRPRPEERRWSRARLRCGVRSWRAVPLLRGPALPGARGHRAPAPYTSTVPVTGAPVTLATGFPVTLGPVVTLPPAAHTPP